MIARLLLSVQAPQALAMGLPRAGLATAGLAPEDERGERGQREGEGGGAAVQRDEAAGPGAHARMPKL